jgi:hypothetical protein
MTGGGSLEDFERLLGPVERLEGQWYEYLQRKVAEVTEPVLVELPETS